MPATAPLFTPAPNPATPAAETPTDFATLVDSIARARSENPIVGTATVGIALTHADFGRVGLQFSPRDDGLAVTLHSTDPGFAPAVAAATASATAPASAGNHQGSQTGQQPAATPQSEFAARGNGGTLHGSPDNAPRGDSRRQDTAPPRRGSPGAAATSPDATDPTGIFA